MFNFSCYFVLFVLLPSFTFSLPIAHENVVSVVDSGPRSYDVPIRSLGRRRGLDKRVNGSTGLGDNSDLLYTVPIEIGNTTTALHLDTGSSDLWIITELCHTHICDKSTSSRYPSASLISSGASVNMTYGDSTTGTFATGPIGADTVSIAGLAMAGQHFAAINTTTNTVVQFGAAGIFGLGFPGESVIQHALVAQQFNNPSSTDELIVSTSNNGPFLSRLAMTDELDEPLFAITLQRDTVDIGGHGTLSIGKLPEGIDNSSLTWVPVRLYSPADGGISPPSFAPNEIYPLRWEIELDGVYLDGQRVPDSNISAQGITSNKVSALVDTGNSLVRGPSDVVYNILSSVSPTFASSNRPQTTATLPCSIPHTMAFQIGGKMFPVDPRDFISPATTGSATTCVASNLVATDAPSSGSLFSWSLGDPFMKSNVVAFYYGNLTHPSVDPPRIGFFSTVPTNAGTLLEDAVQNAKADGGVFESTVDSAPTATIAAESQITVSATAAEVLPIVSSPSVAAPSSTSSVPKKNNAGCSVRSRGWATSWTFAVAVVALVIYGN